jgi:hypothetical protein
MPPTVRLPALAAALVLLAAPAARAGYVTYTFTTDPSDAGGSLAGSFRVDQADLLDGVLSTGDVRDYAFVFTAPSGGTTTYDLFGVFPDIAVDLLTGVPTGFGFVQGNQAGQVSDPGIANVDLTPLALAPGESAWVAITRPTEETATGVGHWDISADVSPVPAPAGAVLALVGAGCLAGSRLARRRAVRADRASENYPGGGNRRSIRWIMAARIIASLVSVRAS